MTDQDLEKRRKNNKTTGIILIVLGVIGLSLRFLFGNHNNEWRTVDVIKLVVSILIIIYGAYTIYKNRA